MPNLNPTYEDFNNFYTHVSTKYNGRQPTTKEWGWETTIEYPTMYHQAAFALWRDRHEREFPPIRTPSPPPHHTVNHIKDAMQRIDFRATPTALVDDYLVAPGFPLFLIGTLDNADYRLIPEPSVITSDRALFSAAKVELASSHILSVIGKPHFLVHILGPLQKRELFEEDLPWRESGYCMALGIDGITGKAGKVYAVKCQQGNCWLGHIVDDVQQLREGLMLEFETVFKEDKMGISLCRALKAADGTLIGSL